MGKLPTKTDVFDNISVGAGLICTSAPSVNETTHVVTITNSSILGVTRGGITFNANPQVRSRQLDGIASNTVGIHVIDRYEPTLSATFVTNEVDILLKAVGFADETAGNIIARHEVSTSTDYVDLWFIERLSNGGSKITKLYNCITTSGAAIKTNDNGETEIPLSFVANYDIDYQDTPPFEIEIVPAPVTPTPTPAQ